mmetsp:Transcript_29898/g.88505  ORF Transcript_29898/g.88505 Transcript_29898/m.88505 type:complete len:235 (+) Transcript_29898:2117-2821(+)
MLALEAAGVLGSNNVAHLLHHVGEALHLLLAAEALRKHEVQIALQRVAKARRVVVAVPLKHLNQVNHHAAQLVDRACHVLDQHAGTRLARGADDRDEALAHVPELLARFGVVVEGVGLQRLGVRCLGAQGQACAAKRAVHLLDVCRECRLGLATALNEQRRCHVVGTLHVGHQREHVLVRLALTQRSTVKQLHSVHTRLRAQHTGASACSTHVREDHKRRRLVGPLGHGVVRGA